LSNNENIDNYSANLHPEDENITAINEKADELVDLLSKSYIDSKTSTQLRQRLEQAIRDAANTGGEPDNNDFSILLSSPQSNRQLIKRYLQGESIQKYVLIAISVIMIILGLGMIIMPAPPFFEMFTIFYFNRDDGITVMDLLSLIIILAGVYFLIKGIYKNPSLRKLFKEDDSITTNKF
jgi:hypothetical protein